MKGKQLANGAGKQKRREHDFYPTPREATLALLDFLQLPPCTVWEPACGDGAMSKVIAEYGHDVLSTELRQSGFGENGVDFLTTSRRADAIITNPPFNISQQFIEHALKQAPVVAMLLKSQYWHAAKRASLIAQFPPAYILPLTWRPDFQNGELGGSPTMEVLWTVWMKGNTQARYVPLKKFSPNHLTFNSESEMVMNTQEVLHQPKHKYTDTMQPILDLFARLVVALETIAAKFGSAPSNVIPFEVEPETKPADKPKAAKAKPAVKEEAPKVDFEALRSECKSSITALVESGRKDAAKKVLAAHGVAKLAELADEKLPDIKADLAKLEEEDLS